MWPSGKLEIKRLSSQRVKAVYGAGFVFGSDLKTKTIATRSQYLLYMYKNLKRSETPNICVW